MSFGDPNNPYGQPPQQPQQGYGQPQYPGAPQQGGHGYPAAPAYGGPPPVQMPMPGTVKGARIMLFVLGGFQVVGGLFMMIASSWFTEYFEDAANSDPNISAEDADRVVSIGVGVMIVLGAIVIGFALWAILTAAKFGTGRGGVRVSAIVYASFVILFSVISLASANLFALISLVLGILIVVYCANKNGAAWFNRPKF
ncbi:hypothetical protein [Streptomyces sp. enrichment culture]|uniref:hypothetical protein n=1 Tax=Streptomyces sp. enrichment culture TaxID=1795815 RepID=UPI003F573AC2